MKDDENKSDDLFERLRQVTQPLKESIDGVVQRQLDQRIDARVGDRLQLLERALADLGRSVSALEERLDRLESPPPAV